MRVLPMAKRVEVVAHLVEGASVRATSRLTTVSLPAILSLLVSMGEGCDRIHDRLVRDLDAREVQCDEIWGYVQKKQARVTDKDPAEWGDAYTFVAMARTCKLILAYRVGKRDAETTDAFIADLRTRMVAVPQLSTDGYQPYPVAIGASFNAVDYAIVHKAYRRGARPDGQPSDYRYEPPRDPFITKLPIFGVPDMARASTSHVERQNLTMRMHIRRMTRLCNSFSRKLANHRAAVALHFAWYNFVRVHEALRCTPAMEAGITDHAWSVEELVATALSEPAGPPPEPKPLRLPEPPAGVPPAPARQTSGGTWLRLIRGGFATLAVKPESPDPEPSPSPPAPKPWRPMKQLSLF